MSVFASRLGSVYKSTQRMYNLDHYDFLQSHHFGFQRILYDVNVLTHYAGGWFYF